MALPTWAKVGIGWSIASVLGIYAFVLSRKSVNAQRYEIMKARQRLRDTNTVD
ncbi:hypothetical protein ALC62_09850 [Cyphomyrmex costatus]|uniref:Uncharacterized protein n=1 Tax=Cyphomyrmex costatus TaxID=456900 RepID=A0A151IEX8_9HYME|nr:hypothetical protein ALC62_09850 [Cyphomyrmex costatus]